LLADPKDETIVAWILNMQKCELFITLQQLKLKVEKVTWTKSTPFSKWSSKKHLMLLVREKTSKDEQMSYRKVT
jgi:hypothetical protein